MDKIVEDIYHKKYKPQEGPRNYGYVWNPRNRVSVCYRQVREVALIQALNECSIHLDKTKILDVGCGDGNILRFFVSIGANPEDLYGIDLLEYRIEKAKRVNPKIHYAVADAEQLPFENESFDIITQFVTFSSMSTRQKQQQAANEMMRVLKKGGVMVWYDIQEKYPGVNPLPQGIGKKEVLELFPETEIVYERSLHSKLTSKAIRIFPFLVSFFDSLAIIPKTHLFMIAKK